MPRALLALALLLAAPATAAAHGPCGCLEPRLAAPGQAVRAASPAYRILFNPRAADLGIAPADLAGAHRPGVPTTTVLDRPEDRPLRRARFRVPEAAPPGLYMVLIFDGDEGGAHNTWDYLHVIGPETAAPAATAASPAPSPAEPDGFAWPLLVAGLLAGAAIGAVATRRVSRGSP